MRSSRKRFTEWADPSAELDSQYGLVTEREWHELEVLRYARSGKRVLVAENGKGKIALKRV